MSHFTPASAMRPTRVLIADDEAAILATYREILEPGAHSERRADRSAMQARLFGGKASAPPVSTPGCELTTCSGAEQALRLAEEAIKAQRPFDVAFLDMRMPPGPDGAWAAQLLRQLDPLLDIVIATAYSDVDPAELAGSVPHGRNLLYMQKPFHPHEVRQLVQTLGWRRQADEDLRRVAYFDSVTGLPNRTLFYRRLSDAIAAAERHGRILALMFIDLDNFKRVNDTLGHAIGDLLLQEVANRLAANIRATDALLQGPLSQDVGEVARLGGDEFTVLLTDLADAGHAGVVAGRLMDALVQPMMLDSQELVVTASIGIALFPRDGSTIDTMLKNADLAMYFAKHAGRNKFHFFDEHMNAAALRRLALEKNLRGSLKNGELSLCYQPQYDIASGVVAGMEALLRWNNPVLGAVSPLDFIPIAEDIGMIEEIGEWVLRTACIQVQAWRELGVTAARVAVNVSARQFVQPGFVAIVQRAIDDSRIAPGMLELEITESILMNDAEKTLAVLSGLKTIGVQLAVDDFGTGYSSLVYLKRFPIDRLKIDRSFIAGLLSNHQDQAIVNTVIALAHSLGLEVTAEGVEDEGQLAFIKSKLCQEVQGFLFSHPLTAPDALRFLQRVMAQGAGAARLAPAHSAIPTPQHRLAR